MKAEYLYTNNESEIKRLDVEIDGKVNVSANAIEMKNSEILMANVRGFDSVFFELRPMHKKGNRN